MIEVAVRISQLVSSNVNNLVGAASDPAKMLKLLIVEIEGAILTLRREISQAERKARDLRLLAERHAKAGADWNDKARFAMSKDREDLARGALAEKTTSLEAAAAAQGEAEQVDADVAGVRETLAALELRLSEARQRLATTARTAPPPPASGAAPSGKSTYSERVLDRLDTIEKRVDFAEAATPAAKAASLDEEIAAMARDAQLDSEMAALRKAVKKKSA